MKGLKLSKMGVLKEELSSQNQMVKHGRFVLQIKLENDIITQSNSFRILSSFSQLPNEWKTKRKSKID